MYRILPSTNCATIKTLVIDLLSVPFHWRDLLPTTLLRNLVRAGPLRQLLLKPRQLAHQHRGSAPSAT